MGSFGVLKLATVLALLQAGSVSLAHETNDMAAMSREFGGRLQGRRLANAIEKAAAHPLGSRESPVRADGPGGEEAYLAQLRCADGAAPVFKRAGNISAGVYGYIIDVYDLVCGTCRSTVFMDMYHLHTERVAVPGFTISEAPNT
jgi:hypothetical protein